MRFGKSAAEAPEDNRATGGGDYMRSLKDGDTTMRILQEIGDWKYYWEHFNPAGFSFPCPRSVDDPVEDCPGCSSDVEKMAKVSRKWAFNALISFNGQDYVTVYKVPNAVYDKMKNRAGRFETITDRDYIITRYKTAGDRYDFDVEGTTPTPIDVSSYELKDIEVLLQKAYDDAWGNPAQVEANLRASAAAAAVQPVVATTTIKRPTIAPTKPPVQPEDPPFDPEEVFQEADLRAMEYEDLLKLLDAQMSLTPPEKLTDSETVVDWLMSIQA